jgi:predicted membrane chloride channel (bestrophin family)
MARTFVFFYVYTVPFALNERQFKSDCALRCDLYPHIWFHGLEYVSIELDNPFGEDANDFDNLGMAETAFEDTYLTILQCDGPQWTDRLRQRMYRTERASGTGTNEIASLLEVV